VVVNPEARSVAANAALAVPARGKSPRKQQ